MNIICVFCGICSAVTYFYYGKETIFQIYIYANLRTKEVSSEKFIANAEYIHTDRSAIVQWYFLFLFRVRLWTLLGHDG